MKLALQLLVLAGGVAFTGTVMRHPDHLAAGERSYPLPYNAFVFRVSRYQS